MDLRTASAGGRAIPVQNYPLTISPSEEIDPVWNPQATKILFASNGEDSNGDGRIDRTRADGTYHLWLMNPDGSGQQQITFDAGNQIEPAWSPNGLRIAYASNEGGDYDIYVLTLSTREKVRLSLGASEERHPSWAASGDAVICQSDFQTGIPKLWLLKLDGSVQQQLTKGPSEDRTPVVSPDGQTIAFQSNGIDTNNDGLIDNAGSDLNIWTMSFFGSNQRQVTAWATKNTTFTEKDPVWSYDGAYLYFASDRKGPAGAWNTRGDFDIYRIPSGQYETANTSAAVQVTQLSPNEPNALTGNEEHPAPFPAAWYNNPKIYYVTDHVGNHDIWMTSMEDITDPRLEALPTVTPRMTIPGQPVTITARVSDLESGVQAVYAQIRDPDDHVNDALGQEHKVFYVTIDNPGASADQQPIWVETDCHMVHATNYTYAIPPYVPPMDDYPALPPADGWLQLFDDGAHNDGAAGDGLYGNTWNTPANAPSDFYLDIIAYDNAGNWKIYDGVWGFTTQPFSAMGKVLYVMDYVHGQKFMQAERSGFGYDRYLPTWFPVESYYTRNPCGMANVNLSLYANNIVNIAPGSSIPPPQYSGSLDTLIKNLTGARDETYSIWRVICRGRVTDDVLAQYWPRTIQQPDPNNPYGAVVNKIACDRAIVWASPYSGDLWVGEGTIVDADTQYKLIRYLDAGGRLILSGQDVAWALTRDGAVTSPLLEKMGVQYVDDCVGISANVEARRINMDVTSGDPLESGPGGIDGGTHVTVPHQHMPQPYSVRVIFRAGSAPTYAVSTTSTSSRESANHTDTDAAGNQLWPDSVLPIPPAVTVYTYNPNGAGPTGRTDGVAAVRKDDPDTGARTVFFAVGIEAFNREYVADMDSTSHSHNWRHNMMHNALCWMRHGTFYGHVQFTAGLAPAEGALVRVLSGQNVIGQAITRQDGTWEIEGVPPGSYRVDAILPGFGASFDHPTAATVHGAGRAVLTFRLSEAPPGSIAGRVTEADGVTAIPGVTITATLQGLYKGQTVQKSATTDQFGTYTIPDLPTGLYEVKASAEGYAEQTYVGGLVQVDAGAVAKADFTMGGVPGSIVGVVTRASDGSLVAGATVELRSGTTVVAQTKTDDNGKYAFTNVPPGSYEITVSGGAGILPTTVTVTVSANATVRRNIAAQTPPPAQIAGTVRDATGAPLAGATVEVLLGTNVIKSVVTGNVQQEGPNSYNYKVTGLSAGTYEVRASKTGLRTASTRVTLQESQQLFAVDFTLESLHVFTSGLTMVSTPFDYSDQDIANLLGLPTSSTKVAQWVGARYAFYPEAPADRFRLGLGYFLQLDKPIPLMREGVAASTTQPYKLTLKPGWNMIGNPFPFIVNWFDAKVQTGSEVITLQDAISRNLIKNALWTYSSGQYRLAFQLVPWEGYWVKAMQGITLLVPNVAGRAAVPDPYRQRRPTEDGWVLQLVAKSGALCDADNYLGVSTQAQDGYDASDVLEAPPVGWADWVQLTFPRRAWGAESGDYAVDLRSPGVQEKVWEFEAGSNVPNAEVTLTWPNVGWLPRRYTAVLEDVDTGTSRYLRSLGSYTFRTGASGGMRRFRLRVMPQEPARLAVTDLQVVSGRGGNLLRFHLSEAARVRVQILSAGMRVVREVEAQVRSAGVQSVVWDGRDARGQALGSGLFFYQVEACSEDGRTVRAIRPFVNVR